MSRMLFLARRMKRGYGVDVEIHEVASRLVSRGHSVNVLCLETDHSFGGPYTVRVAPFAAVEEVLEFAGLCRPDVITAFTSPFIEMLPFCSSTYNCWVWENGDPDPSLFAKEAVARERVKRYKTESCYPRATGVLAISEFVRKDIGWPSAHVIHLGADHAPDLGLKNHQKSRATDGRRFEVGALMRLGKREANYKGNRQLLSLAQRASTAGLPIDFSVMGRGTRRDARAFLDAGFAVSLNASDEDKWTYLRNLDIFVSCSLWEGFNLPLVEAQALGTPAIAFAAGAHREVTPLVFADVSGMLDFLTACAANSDRLLELSHNAYRFSRGAFSWNHTTTRFEELVLSDTRSKTSAGEERTTLPANTPFGLGATRRSKPLAHLAATVRSVRDYGWRMTARKIRHRLRGKVAPTKS